MTDPLRTFIALELSQDHKAVIGNILTSLKCIDADVKWVQPDNCHITLKFLGQTPQVQIPLIAQAMDALAKTVPAFPVGLDNIGAFPDIDKPQIIWIGLSQGNQELRNLSHLVQSQLVQLDFPKETRPFHPHITIGRIRTNRGAKALSQVLKTTPITSQTNESRNITLFESTLSSHGPRYSVIHRSPLK